MIGASKRDWAAFDVVLGLGAHLLPVVPADAKPTPGSKVAAFGKIPSMFNADGDAHGIKNWQKREITPADVARWSADERLSMCVRTGEISGVYAIDCDVTDSDLAQRIAAALPALPRRQRDNSPKFLLAFRLVGSYKKRIITTAAGRIEMLGSGQQFVAAGLHPSGARYEWVGGRPEEMPELSGEAFEARWAALAAEFGVEPVKPEPSEAAHTDKPALTEIDDATLADLRRALAYKPLLDSVGDNGSWSAIGYNLLSLGALGRELWLEFNVNAANPNPGKETPESWWDNHTTANPEHDYTSIFAKARALGWMPIEFPPVTADPGAAPPPSPVGDVPQAHFLCTDLANANRLYAQFGKRLIVVAKTFYAYDGSRWKPDEAFASRCGAQLSELVRNEAKAARAKFNALAEGNELAITVRDTKRRDKSTAVDKLRASENGEDIFNTLLKAEALEKWARQCEAHTNQRNAVDLLRKLLTFDASKLDSDPALLNCLNGTVDLRTGALRPHAPNDFITQLAPTNYDPSAQAPRFEQFLLEIMDGDGERAQFLQRWFGYCATGEVNEQKLVFHIGKGSNGKNSLMDRIHEILGPYAGMAPGGLLTGKNQDKHPTEIADLEGKRLVTASETDAGADLREGLIKNLTGDEKLKARKMRADFSEFRVTHKLQLMTNKKPTIHGQEFGMWRRLLLVHYPIRYGTAPQIADGKADKLIETTLTKTLRGEYAGVLAWIVRGSVDWYANGLQPPESVVEATDEYQDEENRIGQFIDDSGGVFDKRAWCLNADAYRIYGAWSRSNGYVPLGMKRFVAELEGAVPHFRRDVKKESQDGKRRSAYGFFGLRLNDEFPAMVENGDLV